MMSNIKKLPTVGVILPTYNGERWLNLTIESVLNQTYTNVKLYIIDDNSSDNTRSIIDFYTSNYHDRVFNISKHGVKGAPSSRNCVIKNINDELISFIDQDDIWINNKIEIQVAHLIEEDVSLSFGNIEIIDEDGCVKKNNAESENLKRNLFPYYKKGNEIVEKIIEYCPIRIGTVLMTKHSFISSGLFDVSLFGGEDWEFWVRYIAEGNKISHTKNVLALRRIHEKNTSYIHRIKRLENWLNAGSKVQDRYPQLSNSINKFYSLTQYRSIFSCLKKGDNQGAKAINLLFKNRGISRIVDYYALYGIIYLWGLAKPIFYLLISMRNFFLRKIINN